jgi:hypothetical protein
MRESPHPRVELEVATVRATRRPEPRALQDVLRRVEEAEARLRQQSVAAPAPARVQESLLAGVEPTGRTAPEPRRVPSQAERPSSQFASPVPPAPAAVPRPVASAAPSAAGPGAAASEDVATGWQRVVEDVMRKKPTLGAVLAQTRPSGLRDRELLVVLSGNHFHREMLADSANRDLVAQALRRHVAGAERFGVVTEDEGGGGATEHPAVQAAVAEFQGEVVAVRPRLPEGGSQ